MPTHEKLTVTQGTIIMKAFTFLRNKKALLLLAAILLVAATLCIIHSPSRTFDAAAAPLPYILPHEDRQMQIMRVAGLQGDRSQIPLMIAALKVSSHPMVIETALHALAQLGATEALPAMDALMKQESMQFVVDYAKVARARLIAENRAKSVVGSPAQAATKINRFYQELGLTPNDINSTRVLG